MKLIKSLLSFYWEWAKVPYWGVKAILKLVCHYPLHSAFVVTITGAFTFMGVTILNGSEFQILPTWTIITTPYILGVALFFASINWSMRLFKGRN